MPQADATIRAIWDVEYSCPEDSQASGAGEDMTCTYPDGFEFDAFGHVVYSCPNGHQLLDPVGNDQPRCLRIDGVDVIDTFTYECASGAQSSGSGAEMMCTDANGTYQAFKQYSYSCPYGYALLEFEYSYPQLCEPIGPVIAVDEPSLLSSDADWLTTLNWFRQQAGVPGVAEDVEGSAAIRAHVNYLNNTPDSYFTGIYENRHYENPASPYYTPEGVEGGQANLTYGRRTGKAAIESWMAAPFHAFRMISPALEEAAFYGDSTTGIAGLGFSSFAPALATSPVVFPGHESYIHMRHFRGENPDPLESCGYESAGLPLFALLPQSPDAGASATLVDATGTVVESCLVSEHTYFTTDTVYGPAGASLLASSQAVIIIPRQPLNSPRFTVNLDLGNQPDVTWSFNVTGVASEPTTHGLSTWETDVESNAIASNASGDGAIVALKANGDLWTRRFAADGGYEGWVRVGAAGWASADVAIDETGRVEIVAVKEDGRLYTMSWLPGGGLVSWVKHGKATWSSAQPSIATDGTHIMFAAVKSDGRMYTRERIVGRAWGGFKKHGAATWTQVDIDMAADGDVWFVGTKSDGRLYVRKRLNGRWSGYARQGAATWSPTTAPSISARSNGMVFGAVKTDGRLYTREQRDGRWAGFVRHTVRPVPNATTWSAVAVDTNEVGMMALAAVQSRGWLHTRMSIGGGWGELSLHGNSPVWSTAVNPSVTASGPSPQLLATKASGELNTQMFS